MSNTTKKRWGDRKDARWIRDMDSLHVILPHLMNHRTDAEVYVNMEFDVTEALRYIARKNEGEEEYRATLFHCILMAVAKTIYLRPQLNSFISGRRFYQRDEITLGFVAKKRFEDHSEESLVVISAPEDWTLTEVTHRVVGKVHKARTEKNDGVNGAMDVLKKLPRPVLAFVIWIIKTLDFFGKVPDFLRQDDPNFATVFLTNLGSIKCPSVYHHLNNYGSSSIMAAIGTIRKQMNSPKWFWFAIGYECGFAYVIALIVNQLGNLFTGTLMTAGSGAVCNIISLIFAVALLAGLVYMLFRPYKESTKLTKKIKV